MLVIAWLWQHAQPGVRLLHPQRASWLVAGPASRRHFGPCIWSSISHSKFNRNVGKMHVNAINNPTKSQAMGGMNHPRTVALWHCLAGSKSLYPRPAMSPEQTCRWFVAQRNRPVEKVECLVCGCIPNRPQYISAELTRWNEV